MNIAQNKIQTIKIKSEQSQQFSMFLQDGSAIKSELLQAQNHRFLLFRILDLFILLFYFILKIKG